MGNFTIRKIAKGKFKIRMKENFRITKNMDTEFTDFIAGTFMRDTFKKI